MIEAAVAILGGIAGLFLFQAFTKAGAARNQIKLEAEVKEIKAKADAIKATITEREKKTQEQVDAITKEQDKDITGKSLSDWFNQRKGK
jgi:uncharacterized membrane-anchored protein YhcB (DUF1043 family)